MPLRCSLVASWLVLAFLLPKGAAAAGSEVAVTFQVNDAVVKNKVLEGVAIIVARAERDEPVIRGETDATGQLKAKLAAGKYVVTYRRPGYVPLERTLIEVRGTAQVITTTMSALLEAVSEADRRRIQIVLNWGSRVDQVKDLDSHLISGCACSAKERHVYFLHRSHRAAGHSIALDVDDTDWGGPETVTLLDPPPGSYRYWVHKFNSFENQAATLGRSDAIVRVIFADRVAGEYRVREDLASDGWWPFKAIVVDEKLQPRIVAFSAQELAAKADTGVAPRSWSQYGDTIGIIIVMLLAVAVIVLSVRYGKRRG